MLNLFIKKGDPVSNEMEFRESFLFTECNPMHFGIQNVRLGWYLGTLPDPQWVDEDKCEVSSFPYLSFVLT